jgi:hypothetical protein
MDAGLHRPGCHVLAKAVTPEQDRLDVNWDIGALAHRAWSDADARIDELRALEQPWGFRSIVR